MILWRTANCLTSLLCLFPSQQHDTECLYRFMHRRGPQEFPSRMSAIPKPWSGSETADFPLAWLFMRQSTSRNQDGSCRPSRCSLHCHGLLWPAVLMETCSPAEQNQALTTSSCVAFFACHSTWNGGHKSFGIRLHSPSTKVVLWAQLRLEEWILFWSSLVCSLCGSP